MEEREMRRALLTAVAAATFAVPALAADTYTADPVHSEASFTVRHMVRRVRGRFTDFSGALTADPAKPEASSVEFKINATSIDTANANRDKHLRSADFFDVEKFPEITFKSTRIVKKGENTYDVTGPLTIRGVTKDVTLPVSFLGFQKDMQGKQRAGFETSATINRKDYGIVWNRNLDTGGVVLGDDVTVDIVLAMVQKTPDASPAPAAK
jgi:polyisoprenoid-binding protein YceI